MLGSADLKQILLVAVTLKKNLRCAASVVSASHYVLQGLVRNMDYNVYAYCSHTA
jgi:hypothetical protein